MQVGLECIRDVNAGLCTPGMVSADLVPPRTCSAPEIAHALGPDMRQSMLAESQTACSDSDAAIVRMTYYEDDVLDHDFTRLSVQPERKNDHKSDREA